MILAPKNSARPSRAPCIRHFKSYVYIVLLLSIFALMILWDNGYLDLDYERGIVVTHQAEQQHATSEDFTLETTLAAVADESTKHPLGKDEEIAQAISPAAAKAIKEHGNALATLDPNDVLIMFKTGATKMWARAPMHLSTTLANKTLTPNVVFYSDIDDILGDYDVIDALANVSSTLRDSPDFKYWHEIHQARENNRYLDKEGEEATDVLGGWRIDKYKFVPLVAHAARNFPDKKWYVYMEDDNYYFLESFYAWLASFDADQSWFLGGPAGRLGEDFAHGGSGFALSRGAIKKSFGSDLRLASRWDEYSLEQGCGDHILSHVLASKGVKRWRAFDDTGYYPLHALPLWQMPFGAWDWCSPLFNVHKVHQSDMSMLHRWEKKFKATKGGPVRWKDVFTDLVLPKLKPERDEWDNFSGEKHFASVTETDGKGGQTLSDAEKRKRPWFNKDACERACRDWVECMQWSYSDDNCYLDHTAKQGRRVERGIKMTSGWMLDRIKKLQEKECGTLPWWR